MGIIFKRRFKPEKIKYDPPPKPKPYDPIPITAALLDKLDLPKELKEWALDEKLTVEQTMDLLDYFTEKHRFDKKLVKVEDFVNLPDYMGALSDDGESVIFPKVMEALVEMNSGAYDEAVLTGGIGVAKTTLALYSMAYQLYRLSCYLNPHQELGLDPASEIVLVFQSINAKAAKDVDFQRFKAMIDRSKYFREHFPYDKKLDSELKFPRRIIVRPVSGQATAAIGQNILGGIIDEVNFMKRIEDSRVSQDGGTYDQAIALYNSIARRRKSRFMRGGVVPGLLCLVSSKQYPGQFTDKKVEEAQRDVAKHGFSRIYVYDKRTWEVLPPERFSGEFFNLFIGDPQNSPKILTEDTDPLYENADLIMPIPEEHRSDFEKDMLMALRDIAGVSTLARHPYFTNRAHITQCFNRRPSILSRDEVELSTQGVEAYPQKFQQPELARWVHIDIGLTKDALGMACGFVKGARYMDRGDGIIEARLDIAIDFILRVVPPRNGEIDLFRIRKLILSLRDKLGLNIKWVSFDSFQSRDSIQLLRQEGFKSDLYSMDKNSDNYDILKEALADGRVEAPKADRCREELISLEYNAEKGKVDHPPNGSKDLADALAGTVSGLSTRRELYIQCGIPITKIPQLTQPHAGQAKGREPE